jgi:hypothetical protein
MYLSNFLKGLIWFIIYDTVKSVHKFLNDEHFEYYAIKFLIFYIIDIFSFVKLIYIFTEILDDSRESRESGDSREIPDYQEYINFVKIHIKESNIVKFVTFNRFLYIIVILIENLNIFNISMFNIEMMPNEMAHIQIIIMAPIIILFLLTGFFSLICVQIRRYYIYMNINMGIYTGIHTNLKNKDF